MRKMFALAMVALLALTLALTVVGCGQKTEETSTTTVETTPSEGSMPMDSTMNSDSAMSDTLRH